MKIAFTRGLLPSIGHLNKMGIEWFFKHTKVDIETNNPLVIDAIPINDIEDWKIFVCLTSKPRKELEELHNDYLQGIETISELLINRGYWKP